MYIARRQVYIARGQVYIARGHVYIARGQVYLAWGQVSIAREQVYIAWEQVYIAWVYTKINVWRNVLLPVGECTAVLGTLVLPSILQYLVDEFERMFTSLINVEVLLI